MSTWKMSLIVHRKNWFQSSFIHFFLIHASSVKRVGAYSMHGNTTRYENKSDEVRIEYFA